MIFQILSMLCFGVSNCFWEKPVRRMPALNLIVIRSFFTSCLFLVLALLMELTPWNIPLSNIVYFADLSFVDAAHTMAICLINYWGLYFFLKSMQHTDGRISIVMGTAGSLIFVLIGIVVYKESPPPSSYIFMAVFAMGWWFIENLNRQALRFRWSKGVTYALLCMVFWRTSAFFPLVIPKVGIVYFSLLMEMTVCVTSVLILLGKSAMPGLTMLGKQLREHQLHIMCLVVFGFCGVFLFHIAITGTELHRFALIGMIQPMTSVFIGSMLFKTKLSSYQTIGIGILLLGMAAQMWGFG